MKLNSPTQGESRTSPSMVALNAFPPTIMCRWADGMAPGWAAGSRRWMVRVEHGKRRPASIDTTNVAMRAVDSDFILAVGSYERYGARDAAKRRGVLSEAEGA